MTKSSINISHISDAATSAHKISPKIILDSLIEINSSDTINTIFSEKEVFLILKYLNDFLSDEYKSISFERLKELNIYRPLWCDDSCVQLCSSTSDDNNDVYLISEEMAALMKRCFKQNPFEKISTTAFKLPSLKSTELFGEGNGPFRRPKLVVKHKELVNLYARMGMRDLTDLDFFSDLCMPLFFDLSARTQHAILEHLSEEVLAKRDSQDTDKYLEVINYLCIQKYQLELFKEIMETILEFPMITFLKV